MQSKRIIKKQEENCQIYRFAKVRENYFKYLKRVVKENCARCWQMPLTENAIDQISLNIEQHALLASLQTEIYQKSMNEIIRDINTVTNKDLVYNEIKELMTDKMKDPLKTFRNNKDDKVSHLNNKNQNPFWHESEHTLNVASNTVNAFPLESKHMEVLPPITNKYDFQLNSENYARNQHFPLSKVDDFSNKSFHVPFDSSNNVNPSCSPFLHHSAYPVSSSEINSNESIDKCKDYEYDVKKPISRVFPQILLQEKETERDPTVMHNHGESNIGFDCSDSDGGGEAAFSEEDEEDIYNAKADILQILEGEIKSDSNQSGDFYNRADDRDEVSASAIISVKNKNRKCKALSLGDMNEVLQKRKTTNFKTDAYPKNKIKMIDWRLEKNIQIFNFSLRYSQLSEEDRIKNEIIFGDLFGEDSEDEEVDFSSYNLYLTSCLERISPWVVKYLMPYYRQHRIIGREVFKKLGLHVSKLIIEKVQYPDEGLVQSLVSKFFNNSIIYASESDIVEVTVSL